MHILFKMIVEALVAAIVKMGLRKAKELKEEHPIPPIQEMKCIKCTKSKLCLAHQQARRAGQKLTNNSKNKD